MNQEPAPIDDPALIDHPALIDDSDGTLRKNLTVCLAVPRWVEDVASRAPFDSLEHLLSVAGAEATPLAPEEIDQATAHHPRIGERAAGKGAAEAFSRDEQSASEASDPGLAEAIAAGNAAYEKRFGRVFIIRAAGRTRQEILAELQRRLTLDDATELQVVGEQLRDIALLRLATIYGKAGS